MIEEFDLDRTEQYALLALARESISHRLQGKALPSTELGFEKTSRIGAAFVTLHMQGELRGCIGHIRAITPLAETIQEMALAAAFDDPRFQPVRSEELADIDIEISVISPMHRIRDVNEITVGKHGLYISQGHSSGLLLPQVASEQGWDRDAFLAGVCRKAGLSPDAWVRGAVVSIFTAEIFHE